MDINFYAEAVSGGNLSLGKEYVDYFGIEKMIPVNVDTPTLSRRWEDPPLVVAYTTRAGWPIGRYMIESGADVNAQNHDGISALFCAASEQNEHLSYVECDYLLKKGAESNLTDVRGQSILYRAMQYGHISVVDLLLQNGAIPRADDLDRMLQDPPWDMPEIAKMVISFMRTQGLPTGLPPVIESAFLGETAKVVEENLSALADEEFSVLFVAVSAFCGKAAYDRCIAMSSIDVPYDDMADAAAVCGNVEILEDIPHSSIDAVSAIKGALQNEQLETTRFLVEAFPQRIDLFQWCRTPEMYELLNALNVPDSSGSALNTCGNALMADDTSACKYILEKYADNMTKNKLMKVACQMNNIEVLKLCVENRLVPQNYLDEALVAAAESGSIECFIFLMKNGGNINANDQQYGSPLLIAVLRGHSDIVQALVEGGADLSARYWSQENSILHYAAEGSSEILSMLITAGAEVDGKNTYGETPLDFATRKGLRRNVNLLISNGA